MLATESTDATRSSRPTPTREGDDRFVDLAAQAGKVAGEAARRHDADASFVTEGYEALAASGYLALAVPEDLGGSGATIRQACYAQAELARHCGATALASAMHLYNTYVQCFRRRKGAPDADAVLRQIAGGAVVMTSGGSDWLWPTSRAVPVEGGFRVSGRKTFCSQAPAGDVLTTSAVVGEPGEGAEVIMFSMPAAGDGVRLDPTWDTLGMRGTASHDLVLDGVFVPDERVVARREWGRFNPALLAAAVHFAPLVAAVYWGIAGGARDEAVAAVDGRSRGATPLVELPRVHRQVGLMDATLRTAWWSLLGAVDELGDDYEADPAAVTTVMVAKRRVVLDAADVVNMAMDLVGGPAFYRSSPLERAFRDVRAGTFHPFTPESTLTYAGRLALGGDVTTE